MIDRRRRLKLREYPSVQQCNPIAQLYYKLQLQLCRIAVMSCPVPPTSSAYHLPQTAPKKPRSFMEEYQDYAVALWKQHPPPHRALFPLTWPVINSQNPSHHTLVNTPLQNKTHYLVTTLLYHDHALQGFGRWESEVAPTH